MVALVYCVFAFAQAKHIHSTSTSHPNSKKVPRQQCRHNISSAEHDLGRMESTIRQLLSSRLPPLNIGTLIRSKSNTALHLKTCFFETSLPKSGSKTPKNDIPPTENERAKPDIRANIFVSGWILCRNRNRNAIKSVTPSIWDVLLRSCGMNELKTAVRMLTY